MELEGVTKDHSRSFVPFSLSATEMSLIFIYSPTKRRLNTFSCNSSIQWTYKNRQENPRTDRNDRIISNVDTNRIPEIECTFQLIGMIVEHLVNWSC